MLFFKFFIFFMVNIFLRDNPSNPDIRVPHRCNFSLLKRNFVIKLYQDF